MNRRSSRPVSGSNRHSKRRPTWRSYAKDKMVKELKGEVAKAVAAEQAAKAAYHQLTGGRGEFMVVDRDGSPCGGVQDTMIMAVHRPD